MSNFGFRALVQAHSLPERSGSPVKTDHIRESLSEVRADRPHDKFIFECEATFGARRCNHSAGSGLAFQIATATTGTQCK
jgi:hypothetical protein